MGKNFIFEFQVVVVLSCGVAVAALTITLRHFSRVALA